MALKEGKLPPELLAEVVAHTSRAPEVFVGAEVGENAAVVKGHERLVVTADPVTFTEEDIGTYIAAVNANDIVAMGGIPRYLTTTILLPPGTDADRVRTLFERIGRAARAIDLLWIGGHTEVTSAVTRIVVSGQAIGSLERPPTGTGNARPGDVLVLTKWAALEGTTLLARERPGLCARLLGVERHREVLGWLEKPGISIAAEGRVTAHCAVTAGHDPTEGGVATGIHDIASRSGLGARVVLSSIPIREETSILCRALGMDALGLLSSGCYLFTAPRREADLARALLEEASIPAAAIGVMGGPGEPVVLEGQGGDRPLPSFERDEFLRLSQAPREPS
jgi:hydrogenase expression/formation protein HypE